MVAVWIWYSGGFVSCVAHRDNPDLLMVRARDEQSLLTMKEGIEVIGNAFSDDDKIDRDVKIWSMENSDYRWRAIVSKETFSLWINHEIFSYLNYTNFKSALTEVRGEAWHQTAMGVWGQMQKIGDGPQCWGSVGAGGVRIPPKYWPEWKDGAPSEGAVGSTFFDEVEAAEAGFGVDEDRWYTENDEPPESLDQLDEFATDEEWAAYLQAGAEAAKFAENVTAGVAEVEDHLEAELLTAAVPAAKWEKAAVPAAKPAGAAPSKTRRRGKKGRK